MARLPRLVMAGVPMHVVQRGVDRCACFRCPEDYRFYLSVATDLAPAHGCAVHAYVLMTNHVHLLLTPREEDSCWQFMKRLGQRYVQRFNKRWSRTGTLWEGRYYSSLVETDAYLLRCYRYIEQNPLRAGMVAHVGDYRWSSYATNAHGRDDRLVQPHGNYIALGPDVESRRRNYRELLGVSASTAELREIRLATKGGHVLGGKTFQEKMAAILGLHAFAPGRRPSGSENSASENSRSVPMFSDVEQ